MMETFFYLLSWTAMVGAVLSISRVVLCDRKNDPCTDPGLKPFLVPLVPLALIIILEHFRLYGPGLDTVVLGLTLGFMRRSMGAAWLYFCTAHYTLYGWKKKRHSFTPHLVAASIAANIAYVVANAISGQGPLDAISMLVMVAIAFYAGADAVLLTIHDHEYYKSTIVGMRIAMMTMVVYPVVVISDLADVRFPGLSASRPMWSQTNPWYLLVLLAILEPALKKTGRVEKEQARETVIIRSTGKPMSPLTERETEVLALIVNGKSYKDIASLLDVSMPTVKSHISNAYKKLGISRRSQLLGLQPTSQREDVQ